MSEFVDIRNISQCFKIGGEFRSPDEREHGKRFTWDNDLGFFVYEDDVKLSTAARENASNRAEFTQSDGSKVYLSLGALAWANNVDTSSPVTSVFGRVGDITAQNGDYTAAQVTNAFNKAVDDTDDITEGANKFVSATQKANIDLNTTARHGHLNKESVLDLITNAGGGVIPTALQIATWDSYAGTTDEQIQDVVSLLIKNGTGITWVYDDNNATLTPTVDLSAFTTDNLAEGATNKYASTSSGVSGATIVTITLPASSDVATRVAGAVEGTDYPTGWALSADSAVNLLITHTLAGRTVAHVNVFEALSGTTSRLAKPFSDAYTGVVGDTSNDTILIEGLDTLAVALRIEILFTA